tara:strand:- start:1095 stop:1304 length:210 start_codon:yes stop_codon:yes gene_type:complete
MGATEVVELLKGAGGYGVAALMYYFLKQEKAERLRYRDFHEETLKELLMLPVALQELTDEIARKNQKRI